MTDIVVFGLLLLLSVAFICAPLLRRHFSAGDAVDQGLKNAELFREQEALLRQQLADGEIDQQQYDELHTEQQRLLLIDAEQKVAVEVSHENRGRMLVLSLALLLPVAALSLYYFLGATADIRIAELMNQQDQARTEAEYTALRSRLVNQIEKRLEQKPDHGGYQVTQARLMTEMREYTRASDHYRKAMEIFPEDARLIAEYAQVEYFAADSQFTPNVLLSIERALAIDPENGTALGLRGIQAYRNDDYRAAISSWQAALRNLPPNSPQAAVFKSSIAMASKALGEPLPGLSVDIALSPQFKLQPGDVLYVFAREVGPRPMPVAVVKMDASELPATVLLDDSAVMPGGKTLSEVSEVQVVARVSRTGSVMPSPGDLEAASDVIKLDGGQRKLDLVIDKMVPLPVVSKEDGIEVSVSLDPSLLPLPEQVLFVYAREVDGPPMPLAIQRLSAADLPTTVVLDDSMAMPGGKPLSAARRVEIVARVSATGTAMTAPGDFIGTSEGLEMASGPHRVDVVISEVVP